MRDAGETDAGGFGLSAADNVRLVEDFQLVRQVCDVACVSCDDTSVADFSTGRLTPGSAAMRITYLKEMNWSQEQSLIGANRIAALRFCEVEIASAMK